MPTLESYLELQANHIPAEMHIYTHGTLNFGSPPSKGPRSSSQNWQDRLSDWLADRRISKQ